jgi:hypothetical protein
MLSATKHLAWHRNQRVKNLLRYEKYFVARCLPHAFFIAIPLASNILSSPE